MESIWAILELLLISAIVLAFGLAAAIVFETFRRRFNHTYVFTITPSNKKNPICSSSEMLVYGFSILILCFKFGNSEEDLIICVFIITPFSKKLYFFLIFFWIFGVWFFDLDFVLWILWSLCMFIRTPFSKRALVCIFLNYCCMNFLVLILYFAGMWKLLLFLKIRLHLSRYLLIHLKKLNLLHLLCFPWKR